MKSHWIDDLARTLGRSTLVGGFRQLLQRGPGSFALVQSPESTTIQAGPCAMQLRGAELIDTFATQSSTDDGQLLSLSATTIRDRQTNAVRAQVAIHRGRQSVLQIETARLPDGTSSLTATFGYGFQGLREVQAQRTADRLAGMIDGRPWQPLDFTARSAATLQPEDFQLVDGSTLSPVEIDSALAAELTAISYKAQRDMPGCTQFPDAFKTLSGSSFPGCDDCLNVCDKAEKKCLAGISAAAAACGPFYGACLAAAGAACLSDSSDCQNACINPPGACCPRRCEQGGYAECCTPDHTCCGARCCPPGEFCADPAHDLCCAPNSGPPCRDLCCPLGYTCANEYRGFCCPVGAGEYCTQVWDEEHWNDRCCPAGEVCADASIGLCCPRGHGPICGDFCCQAGEVCRHGQCCDPRLLCGYGDEATCCHGECRDGQCCSSPAHMCGDVCCPPFNPCCQADGRPICCGAYEECLPRGCCPTERACGRTCCPPQHYCDDPATESCVACEGDLFPCLTVDRHGRHGLCCPPNVGCCGDRCCQPGEMCCSLGDEIGCHPSYACVH